jgi:hypothetical protein
MLTGIRWQTVQQHNRILFVAGNFNDCQTHDAAYRMVDMSGLRRPASLAKPSLDERIGTSGANLEGKPEVTLIKSRSHVPVKRRGRGRG